MQLELNGLAEFKRINYNSILLLLAMDQVAHFIFIHLIAGIILHKFDLQLTLQSVYWS